jgi:Protein of unknown function (DUF4241)
MLGVGTAMGLVLVIAIGLLAPRAGTPVGTPAAPVTAAASPSVASRAAPPLADAMGVEGVYARFASGGVASAGGEPVALSTEHAGDLDLQTGRVVAGDAMYLYPMPFTQWLAPGRHPVFVLHAVAGPPRDDRIAAALIRVAPGDPVRWELALVPGQDVARLQPGQFFGYGVDSGTGSFASAEAAEWLAGAGGRAYDEFGQRLYATMFPSRNDMHPVADIPLGDPKGLNVIAFASGWGDGSYPSYFGLDASGQPIVLLTDFQILDAGS